MADASPHVGKVIYYTGGGGWTEETRFAGRDGWYRITDAWQIQPGEPVFHDMANARVPRLMTLRENGADWVLSIEPLPDDDERYAAGGSGG